MGTDDGSGSDRRYQLRAEAVDWLDVEDQVVALHGERSLYLSTNSSGASLWHVLVEGATVNQLVEQLVETYGIDAERALSDATAFLDMVSEQGLLEGGQT